MICKKMAAIFATIFMFCMYVAVGQNNKSFESYLQDINYYAQYGQHDKVIALCQKALAIKPKDTELLEALGDAYFHTKKFTQAIAPYSKALAANDELVSCYRMRGKCYVALKQYDKAMPDLRKAVKLGDEQNKDMTENYMALGDALYRQNPSSTEAAAIFNTAWTTESYSNSNNLKKETVVGYPKSAAIIWPEEHIPTEAEKAQAKKEAEAKEKAYYAKMEADDGARKKEDEALVAKKKQLGKYYYEPTESDIALWQARDKFILRDEADRSLDQGRYQEAARYYHIYAKAYPDKGVAENGLAKVYFYASEYTTALYYIDKATEAQTATDYINYMAVFKAETYRGMKRYPEFESAIKPFLQSDTRFKGPAHLMMGASLKERGKPKTVYLPWFEKAVTYGGDEMKLRLQKEEPEAFATLYPNDKNWKPKPQETWGIDAVAEEPAKPATGSKSSSGGSGTQVAKTTKPPAERKQVPCPACDGTGKQLADCITCLGSGYKDLQVPKSTSYTEVMVYDRPNTDEGQLVKKRITTTTYRTDVVRCSTCNGSGNRKTNKDCVLCHGRKYVWQ
jgi:tetratricopeptide (TPR) repeat protein